MYGNALGADEIGDDFRQSAMFLAGVAFFNHAFQLAAFSLEGCQTAAGSANIACENHGSIFLHRRPSRASNSSDSAGPQVPDA